MHYKNDARLIDASALFDSMFEKYGDELNEDVADIFMELINEAPTVSLEPANDPLTLDELRGMDKVPVWVEEREEPEYSGWYILYWDRGKYLVLQSISTHGFLKDEYGKTWLAYRRKPEQPTTPTQPEPVPPEYSHIVKRFNRKE